MSRTVLVVLAAAAGVGALLAVLVVSGVVLGDDREAAAPAPTPAEPTPAPTTTPAPEATAEEAATPTEPPLPAPTSTPLPGPRPDGIDDIAAQVAALRGLPVGDPIDARVVGAQALGDKFTALAFADLDPDDLEADRRLLVALRILDPADDLRGIVETLFREQILGLYVIEEKVFYVAGDDVALTPYQQITTAHEVAHALQDRAYDLDALLDIDDREADAALAVRALVEGDAVVLQDRWTAAHLSAEAQDAAFAEGQARSSPALATAPSYVAESILFPYVDGARFVRALLDAGGAEALEAAFANPPTTTTQILHPERYLAGEQPVVVEIGATPGAGWDEGAVVTFGEFDLDHLLRPLGRIEAEQLADGLVGGEARSWRRGDADAAAVAMAFGTAGDAEAVCAAAPRWYAATSDEVAEVDGGWRSATDAFALRCTTTGVTLAIAPDPETAAALAQP